MTNIINNQICLANRPNGLPKQTDWQHTKVQIPTLQSGELLVKVEYISLDPAMRGWMNDSQSYIPPVPIGDVMRALGAGVVIDSQNKNFSVGDYVSGLFGVQEYCVTKGANVSKLDINLAPLPVYLGALGMPGLTAYFGLLDVGRPKPGETIVVSGAAGAVGTVVGQIGKIKGCRVVGIAGSDEKCRYVVDELNFDAAINYHTEHVKHCLEKYCPQGIHVYFDNVGGNILNDALSMIALHARVVICGAISQYNSSSIVGPANYLALLIKRASMSGFIVFDYVDRYSEALKQLATWYHSGELKTCEDIVEGLETFPTTFLKLFKGENLGKLILKVA